MPEKNNLSDITSFYSCVWMGRSIFFRFSVVGVPTFSK
ncbi:hypothetical protein LEP1GSC086_0879 [Leptospira weilii str. LNT 1234]|nr:hypothetical protein LEP1GSC086_0879 [Leptospira weilii str. LNT 1234]